MQYYLEFTKEKKRVTLVKKNLDRITASSYIGFRPVGLTV